MTDLILCLADPGRQRLAHIVPNGNGLRCAGATPGFRPAVETLLAELARDGVTRRTEHAAAGTIGVDFVAVGPAEPGYLAAAAEACRSRGYQARLLPPKPARIWRLVLTLPLPPEIRGAVLPNLEALTEEQTDGLLADLEEAEKGLDEAGERAVAAMQAAARLEEKTELDIKEECQRRRKQDR